MNKEKTMPKSRVGKVYALNESQKDKKLPKIEYENSPCNDLIKRFVKKEHQYQRNHARICSFFIKGCCNRGLECPYRHTVPVLNQIPKQIYDDRFNGINDPVAHKMLSRVANMASLTPPVNKRIKTIFVGNITPRITAKLL